MKNTQKAKPAKPKRGRPPTGEPRKRDRPVLKTTVSPATYAGVNGERRPAGRVIDDMWTLYSAAKSGDHDALAILVRTLRTQ